MTAVRYFALRRLPIYKLDGEPLTVEPGELLPDDLIAAWGDTGVSAAIDGRKIAPVPGWIVGLMPDAKPKRVKAAA